MRYFSNIGVTYRRSRETGQSSVEFALVLPLVLVTVLALSQVGVIAAKQLWLSHVAREAVRVLAHNPDLDAGSVVEGFAGSTSEPLRAHSHLEVISGGSVITLTLEHDVKVLQIFGLLTKEVELSARTSMVILE